MKQATAIAPHTHTHTRSSQSPAADCHLSLGSPSGHQSCTWVWDGEKCEISITLSFVHLLRRRHTAQDKRKTADICTVFSMETPASKKPPVAFPHIMTRLRNGQRQNLCNASRLTGIALKYESFPLRGTSGEAACSYTQVEGSPF